MNQTFGMSESQGWERADSFQRVSLMSLCIRITISEVCPPLSLGSVASQSIGEVFSHFKRAGLVLPHARNERTRSRAGEQIRCCRWNQSPTLIPSSSASHNLLYTHTGTYTHTTPCGERVNFLEREREREREREGEREREREKGMGVDKREGLLLSGDESANKTQELQGSRGQMHM